MELANHSSAHPNPKETESPPQEETQLPSSASPSAPVADCLLSEATEEQSNDSLPPPPKELISSVEAPASEALPDGSSASSKKRRDKRDGQRRVAEESPFSEEQQQQLIALEVPQEKIELLLTFMEQSLAESAASRLKPFWEARKLLLELFKVELPPAIRTPLWTRYTDLLAEARRLKQLLDEQSAFAVEQIGIAVKDLEEGIEKMAIELQKEPTGLQDPPQFMREKLPELNQMQRELTLLNTFATRINVLREELVKTDMRIRTKNDFFKKLSLLGDKVYPRRKDLTKACSQQFIEWVDQFLTAHFVDEAQMSGDLFALREEIKAFQNCAKQLFLNPHAFKRSRERLSQAWDRLKELDRERRRDRAQKKSLYKQNSDALLAELKAVEAQVEQGLISEEKLFEECRLFQGRMRKVELGREEIQQLRDALAAVRKPFDAKREAEELNRKEAEKQQQQQRVELVQETKNQIEQLLTGHEPLSVEALLAKRDQLLVDLQSLSLSRSERYQMDQLLRRLKDFISHRQDAALLSLASSCQEGGGDEELKALLSHRKQVKEQLELLKREEGASGLDFAKAIELSQELAQVRERLENLDRAVHELSKRHRS